MLEGISVDDEIIFVSERDKTEPKTEFVLKPLTFEQMSKIQINEETAEVSLDLLCLSVKEIRNLNGETFAGEAVREKVKLLPFWLVKELMEKFNEINNITEQEEKN